MSRNEIEQLKTEKRAATPDCQLSESEIRAILESPDCYSQFTVEEARRQNDERTKEPAWFAGEAV